ncbi:hypothetical protein GINT2_001238 [Glugoides intestinalis]
MDNKSFSLQFNPLINVKCVKDYEDEIARLKAENFELKAQITHSNIPKVLYENKKEMDGLLQQSQELQNTLDNATRAYESLLQDKKVLENKYNQDLTVAIEKQSLLEDENKRLILRLEKSNKEMQEASNVRNELIKSGEELNVYRGTIQNLERQNEQMRYDFEQRLASMRESFESFKRDAEAEINSKDREVEMHRKKYEIAVQKEKNNSFIISDLKATLNSQLREKTIIDEMKEGENAMKSRITILEKEKQDIINKIEKEHRVYLNGMEKFKQILVQKLTGVTTDLVGMRDKLLRVKALCYISEENRNLFSKMKLKYTSINDLIIFFKEKHAELYKRIECLKQEATTKVDAAMVKKTQTVILEFRSQFNEAKNELLVCKKYLEKKAVENKALRSENARLIAEATKKANKYTETFGFYDNKIGKMKI